MGVSEFRTTGTTLAPLAGALSGLVAHELQRMGAFKVTSASQVQQLLSLERQKQLLGCSDEQCQSAAAADLGFDFFIPGTLTRVGTTLSLELLLLDQKNASRAGSEVISAQGETELMAKVSPAIARLVGKLLKERSGSLVLRSSEAGAVLKVDDVAVGTTPLEGRLQLAGGPHFLSVEKEGFTSWQKEIRINADQLLEESVHLAPSPDFIEAYESKQRKLRAGAWIVTVVTVAAAATAVAFEVRAASLYGSKEAPGSFVALRELVAAGDESHREPLNQRRSEISSSQLLTGIFLGVAVAGAAGACALWLVGDDPGRYSAYREVGLKASVSVGPNGAHAILTGGW